MKSFLAFLLILLILAACKTAGFYPTAEDFMRKENAWAGYTYGNLKHGYDLYLGKCSSCHRLYKPSEYSESDWTKILADMEEKAGLDSIQAELITRYIFTMHGATGKSLSR